MLPPWPLPLPLRHSRSCLYTRSVFERKKNNCDTVVIHALPVHENYLLRIFLNFCVRSSGARPRHRAKDCCCGWAHYLVHLLTTAAWYSTWSSIVWGLHSHTNAARRSQFTMQTALQHHLIICTEDVTTAARRTLQGYIQIFSRDTTVSSSSSYPRTSAN